MIWFVVIILVLVKLTVTESKIVQEAIVESYLKLGKNCTNSEYTDIVFMFILEDNSLY